MTESDDHRKKNQVIHGGDEQRVPIARNKAQGFFIDTRETKTEGDNRKPHRIQEPPCHSYKVSKSTNGITEYRIHDHVLVQTKI